MIEVEGDLTSLCVSSAVIETSPGGQQVAKITYWMLTKTSNTSHSHGPCEMTFFAGQHDWDEPTRTLKDFIKSIEANLAQTMGASIKEAKTEALPDGLVSKGI